MKIKFFYSPQVLKTNTDASIRVFKFHPERTGFNTYAEYTQLQLTFLALQPWFTLDWNKINNSLYKQQEGCKHELI